MFPFHLEKKKICDIISKTELAWTHQMIMKKQCYISDGLIAALSLALAPPSTLRIPSLAFPNLFEVSGSPGLRKVTQSTEVQEDKAVTLCPQPWCISKQKGKQKKKILTLVQIQSKCFSFFLCFSFEVQFCVFHCFIFILCFYLCPSCFQQGSEVLKTLQKVCSVDISYRDWSRKYDLWTSTPLMHYH